ncbi:MAG: endolytic transglycosylase MltG [Bacteroidales bacterium]|nr:endolytic transglycosylase MltG [Bacteroidales bacterium]MDT8432756.1 endolytic transglycosylase MltG [Bacteroidales bacterium]
MLERKRTRSAGKVVRLSLLVVFVGLMVSVIVVFSKYQDVFNENIEIEAGHEFFYIPTGSAYAEVWGNLEALNILIDKKSFQWVAEKKGYPGNVKPGRYRIEDGMNNNELVNMLRSGNQEPVMVIFNNLRTLEMLAGKVASYIEPDSLELRYHLLDPELPSKYGFTRETFMAMFIPNTYEMYWSSTPEDFTDRMAQEYEKFWEKRDKKLEDVGLSRVEVSTLASLVDEETLYDEENERVAGVYMNRIQMGMALQSCPTLKFALNDWTITRVLHEYKQVESMYNTYKHKGLPPGPITIPSVSAIDGVLNYEDHNYIYMCAKDDFSGKHAFARTLKQHNENAAAYQRELNKRKIYR